jgi:protein-L-isoaspartate(D-aspartate) O-methyltransferase
MSDKERTFPLPLSSVMKSGNNGTNKSNLNSTQLANSSTKSATRQTATQNVIKHASVNLLSNQHRSDATNLSNNGATIYQSSVVRQTPYNFQVVASTMMVSDKIRKAMVGRVAQQGVKDQLVLSALEAIPRHLFIESGLSSQAYIDASLPIGHHQTISKPYIVARMTEILRNGRQLNKILEIGTGCGYQAAVLSLVAKEVYSIERIKALHELAKNNLRPMRIGNIRLHYGDGMLGLPQAAPFDGIILAAAGMEVPSALLQQLSIGGRLIAPVGGKNQVLELIERVSENEWKSTIMEECHFVPLHQGTI